MSMIVRVFGHMLIYEHGSVFGQQLVHDNECVSIRLEGIV